ncbi:MAG: hypothetical protein KAW88_07345 [Candidatus Cloacimonetes bacterium]|nr:hypothetical protein [Candidatus Cloacimonadota bacterium]
MPDLLIGLLVVIIGVVLSGITLLIMHKKKEFDKTSSKFRESFVDELLFLESPIDKPYPSPTVDILKEAYNKHNKALTHFLPYLRRSIRNAIKKAFRKYSDPYDTESHKSEIDINDSSFIFYDGYGDTTTILNYHQKKVENLL